jgi:hypothetical protein
VFRERRTNQSKGCGFVLMAARGAAIAAMDALDEKHVMVGGWGGAGLGGGVFEEGRGGEDGRRLLLLRRRRPRRLQSGARRSRE